MFSSDLHSEPFALCHSERSEESRSVAAEHLPHSDEDLLSNDGVTGFIAFVLDKELLGSSRGLCSLG